VKKKKLARTGIFINSNGDEFTITGVPPALFDEMRIALENEWREIGRELPSVPVYMTEANEVVDWNEEAVMVDGTPEEIQEWQDYENAWLEFQGEYNVRRMRVAFTHIQNDPAEDQDWIDEMEAAGIPVPEERKELKQLYGRTKVLASVGITGDLTRLLIELQALSGMIDQKVVRAFRASFRAYMEESSSGGPARESEEPGELAVIEPVPPGGDGPLLGEETE
jgi:hypothetical protein